VTKSELLARVPPVYRLAREVQDRRHERSSEPTRHKHAVLRSAAHDHDLHVLVETGTYTGETAWAFRREFERIETIELEPGLARLARIRFARTPAVHVHEGDSALVLPQILSSLDRPALFWLDAHPHTDRSANDAPVPLVAELSAIAAHPVRGHVVLVDDMRLMGSAGFPSIDDLSLPGYSFQRLEDVGLLAPATSS
jgi:hypothetical protein